MSLARLPSLTLRTSLRASTIRALSTTAALKSATPKYEFLVIVRDLPNAKRQNLPPVTESPVLASQTFTGEILQDVKVLGDESNRLPGARAGGNVLACRAGSVEDVEEQVRRHPYAKAVWDMESMTIWPLDTVHTSPFSSAGAGQ